MDQRYERIIERLDLRSRSHPNIASVWRAHLRSRMDKLEAEMERCEVVLEAMNGHEDIPLDVLRDISVLVSLFCGNNT